MSRSQRILYKEKYDEYKQSEKYAIRNKQQVESNAAKTYCKELAGYICAICGGDALDAHHIIAQELGGSNEQSNLICLCRKCHQQVHSGVYIIDPETKVIDIGKVDEITDEKKPEYIKEFEKKIGTTVYRNTGRYYAFIDGVKTKFTAAEIKAAINYIPVSTQKKIAAAKKKQNVKERKILAEYKKMLKECGATRLWHDTCKVINVWDSLSDVQKNHIFEVLNRYFSKD
ncbi:MAG: HNH endonuclease [Clostridia bacterium]|nr:HNH endonuclease [Clostridia bacterium]